MSEENSNLAEIQKHREQIDEIDREIVALLNQARPVTRWSSAV